MSRPRRLRVYVGKIGNKHALIAAGSQKELARLAGVSEHASRRHWHETSTPFFCAIAMAKPGSLFVNDPHSDAGWVETKVKRK